MRKTTALIAALALLGSLTGCAGADTVEGCSPSLTSGSASSLVTAAGDFGTAPKVKFPTPLFTKTSQVTQLIAGKGAAISDGQPVVLDVTIINAATGTVLQKTDYGTDGGSLITTGKSTFPAVSEALKCAQVGARLAIVGSAQDSHNGVADAANNIGKDDSFVYVVDVRRAFLARAQGVRPIPEHGLPSVVTTADGTPGISLPSATPPTSAKIAVLEEGSGAVVKDKQYVVVKYTAIAWADKTVFDSTWSTHQASVIQVGSANVSAGLSKALVGKRVGSQVIAVLPPNDDVVADGSGKAPQGATSVYVVDILGIAQ